MTAVQTAPIRKPPTPARVSRETRDEIVLAHMSLVKAIAYRVHQNLPVHVDLHDLEHAGILGLLDAAARYRPDANVAFHNYAKHRIKGAILDSLRQLDWASRDMRKRQKQVDATAHLLTLQLHRAPTDQEMAERLDVSVDRWRQISLELRSAGPAVTTRDDRQSPMDVAEHGGLRPDSLCAQSELRGVLRDAASDLPERYRQVVSLYYDGDKTMKEIACEMGINESRVSQIHKAALERMAATLQTAGIHSTAACLAS